MNKILSIKKNKNSRLTKKPSIFFKQTKQSKATKINKVVKLTTKEIDNYPSLFFGLSKITSTKLKTRNVITKI